MKIIEPVFPLELEGFKFLGRGPAATGSKNSWPQRWRLYYRCAKCGSMMYSKTKDYFDCKCGAMHLDIDHGRFGSNFGDQNILVYKKEDCLTKWLKRTS